MNTTVHPTQPDAAFRAKLLDGIVTPQAQRSPSWLAHTWASICWSYVTEPADTTAGNLCGIFGSAEALELVMNSTPEFVHGQVEALGGVSIPLERIQSGMKAWLPRFSMTAILDTVRIAREKGIKVITDWDQEWPEGFFTLGSDAPHCLWIRGELESLHLPAVSFVGARAATSYGEHVAAELASDLSGTHVVVSGGAYGIDGAAHRAAIASSGKTIAYMAGGVDRPYPMGHAQLLERITITGGALVSEVPPGSAPTKWRFLSRNRLIAAHAQAVIVVEAGWRSGSMNTAGHAVGLGRPLGAVPGPVTSAASAGCHRILREMDGVCITSAADVRALLED